MEQAKLMITQMKSKEKLIKWNMDRKTKAVKKEIEKQDML